MRWTFAAAACVAAFSFASVAFAVGVAARVNAPHAVNAPIEFAANGVGTGELSFTWNFGDGTPTVSGDVVTHAYEEPGHYPVIVVVKDSTGATRSDSFLQTVHRALPSRAPESSSSIVFHRAEGRVCNVNADNDTVSCISTDTHELSFEAPVDPGPRTLAVAPDGALWVVSQDAAVVSVLDAEGALLEAIELPRASRPYGIVMSADRGKAYVSLQALGEVAELDLTTMALVRRVAVGPWATGLALDSEAQRLFVTRFISPAERGEVAEVDVDTFTVKRTFELAMDPGPDTEASARGVPNYVNAAVVSPDGSALWVPSKKDNVLRGEARDGEALTFETSVRTIVSHVDLATNAEVLGRRIDLNNRTLGLSLAFSPLGDYAFVALLGNNGVEVLDAYDGRVVAGAFELGKAPNGLVLDDAGRLYVNSYLSRSVVVLDATQVLASTSFELPVLTEIVVSTAEKLDALVLEGKKVFYDASDLRMTKDGYISCAACHLDGFEDGQVWDFTDRGEGLRNTTSLLGKRGVGQGPLHWTANFDEVQDFEHDIRGAFGGSGFLSDELFEEGTRNTSLGDPKAGLSPELDALAAYVTSLDSVHPSPYRAQDGRLTEQGYRGREIFERAGCATCHSGPDFTDSATGVLHDVGTLQATSGQRLGKELEGIDTPTLRGIWATAPYLHDGSAQTLLEVVGSRNAEDRHGTTSNLSDEEREALVSYLLQIDNVALEDEVAPERAPSVSSGGEGCSVHPHFAGRVGRSATGAALSLFGLFLFAWRRGLRERCSRSPSP